MSALVAVWVQPSMQAQADVCNDPGWFTNNGGPFMRDPRVYLIFWGPGWQSNPSNVIGTQEELLSTLAGSSYNGALSQYCISNDVSFAGAWWDSGSTPAQDLTDGETGNEVDKVVPLNPAWVQDGNSLFEVLPQPGTSYGNPVAPNTKDYCAYHATTSAGHYFSVVPYEGDANPQSLNIDPSCLPNYGPAPELAMTTLASHEYAEAATDPNNATGWKYGASEIGDICQKGVYDSQAWASFGSVAAQNLWNNPSSDCSIRPDSVPPMAPAGPALATWQNSGQQDVYWRGTDGNLWEDVWSGGKWWASPGHLGVGPMGSEPAVVTNPARNEEDVFWQGMDNQLYEAYYSNTQAKWFFVSPVKPAMGPLGSQPAVAAWPTGHQAGQQDVFWKGMNGRLWETSWSNGSWTQPHEPFSSGTLGSAPAVVVNPGRTTEEDVFWRGTGGDIWEAYWTGGSTWNGPYEAVAASVGSQPSVGAKPDTAQQDLFWRGTDSALTEAYTTSNGWFNAGPVGGTKSMYSAPTEVWNSAFMQDNVFWKASPPGSGVYEVYWAGGWQYPGGIPNTGPIG